MPEQERPLVSFRVISDEDVHRVHSSLQDAMANVADRVREGDTNVIVYGLDDPHKTLQGFRESPDVLLFQQGAGYSERGLRELETSVDNASNERRVVNPTDAEMAESEAEWHPSYAVDDINIVEVSEWIGDGVYETRTAIGEMDGKFYGGTEVSQQGGDSDIHWGPAFNTREEAEADMYDRMDEIDRRHDAIAIAREQQEIAAFTARVGNHVPEPAGGDEPASDRVQMLTRGRELTEQERFITPAEAGEWTLQQHGTSPAGEPWFVLQKQDESNDLRTVSGSREELDKVVAEYGLTPRELPPITEGTYYREPVGGVELSPEIRREESLSVSV